MLIDVHAHLTGDEYDSVGGVSALLARMKEHGVGRVIASGYDVDTSVLSKELAEKTGAAFAPCLSALCRELKESSYDCIVFMGAGDIGAFKKYF